MREGRGGEGKGGCGSIKVILSGHKTRYFNYITSHFQHVIKKGLGRQSVVRM